MKKIVNPCVCKIQCNDGNTREVNAFAKIIYENGRLSITGVIGPMSNGDALGSSGQCVNEIRNGMVKIDWTLPMLYKFCDIWKEWHLNDMHPECEHQRKLGWDVLATQDIKVEKWTLTREAHKIQDAAKNRVIQCLKDGQTFTPTDEETAYANLPYEVVVYNDEGRPYGNTIYRDAYELREKDCIGNSMTTYKERGWISYKEHPLGLLGRPCPVCGYGYGTSWNKVEVPQNVIDWLFNLPDSKLTPAWI